MMSRIILIMFVVSLYIVAVPVAAQETTNCPTPSDETPPPLDYSPQIGEDLGDLFSPPIVDFLNITGSPDSIADAIIVLDNPEQPTVTVQAFTEDVTGDAKQDLLVSITSRWGGGYYNLIGLYTCSDGSYVTLDIIGGGDFINFTDDPPTTILAFTDMNNNQRPEIVQRRGRALQKFEEIIDIFEWNDDELLEVFSTGYSLGWFNDITVSDIDEDADTLELLVGDQWGYRTATVTSTNEIIRWRPIETTYAWDGETYAPICNVFVDEPSMRFEALHSAETHRACGDFDAATIFYQLLLDDELESWPWPNGLDLTDVDDDAVEAYVAELESAYLRAFAYYRMVQLDLLEDDVDAALETLEMAQTEYMSGQQGFQYVAMAEALIDAYQETNDLGEACDAAEIVYEQVRENGDDPGIAYTADERSDGTSFQFPFYWDSGIVNSSDPDDMFNVPEGVADLIEIPICIE